MSESVFMTLAMLFHVCVFFFYDRARTRSVAKLRSFLSNRIITYPPLQPISHIAIKRPHRMITEGPRINLTLLDASVKEGDSHVAESCSMRQTNRRENYVHARGDPAEGSARGGRGRRTGNVFKFMAAFKTPSANGRGLQREPLREKGKGSCKRRERGSLGGNGEVEGGPGGGGFCLMHSDA